MVTKLDIQYDPSELVAALKHSAGAADSQTKAFDRLGAAAVNAADDIYGFESAEWKAADAAEKAERDVRNFADDLEYLAKEAAEATKELDRFGDKAVRAGHAGGTFKKAGGLIGAGIAGAIGGAALSAAGAVAGVIGEKFKELGKQGIFDVLLDEGTLVGDTLDTLAIGWKGIAESIGLANEGVARNHVLTEAAMEAQKRGAQLDAAVAAKKEAEQAKLLKQKEQESRIQNVLAGEQAKSFAAEQSHWAQTLKTIEEVDGYYKDFLAAAKTEAESFEFTEKKAHELEQTLDILRQRRTALELEAIQKREDAEKQSIEEKKAAEKQAIDQMEAERQAFRDRELAAEAKQKQEMDKQKDAVGKSGIADEIIGSIDSKDIDRQVKSNRKAQFALRMEQEAQTPDFATNPRQRQRRRREIQKEIFGQPVSAEERSDATSQLAQATINEAVSRGGVDQSIGNFMTEAVKSKQQQESENARFQQQIDRLTAIMDSGNRNGRARAQRAGRN